LKEGFSYVKDNKGLRSAVLLAAAMSLLVLPYTNLLPVYAVSVFKGNVTTFSWLNSISGLGALMGAIFIATLKPGKDFMKIISYAALVFSAGLVAFAYTTNLKIALVLIMVAESGLLVEVAATNTYIQTHVEEHMRGRVVSYYVMAFLGMQPIGGLLVGSLAHLIGTPLTVLIEGLCGITAALLFTPVLKSKRKMLKEKMTEFAKRISEV
jgi:MFS family permease